MRVHFVKKCGDVVRGPWCIVSGCGCELKTDNGSLAISILLSTYRSSESGERFQRLFLATAELKEWRVESREPAIACLHAPCSMLLALHWPRIGD